MTAEHPTVSPAPLATSTGAMIKTLGLVSGICGLVIVGSYQGTYDAVAANKRVAIERAVFKVVPDAKSIEEYYALEGGGIAKAGTPIPAGAVKFFAAYNEQGRLTGIAAEGVAKGYADAVRIMFAYKSDCECITGIGVVAMRETPGIGDKIVKDKAFLENFKSLEAGLTADMSKLAREIRTVKHGAKTSPWEIDAIAGATITSRAVGRAINESAQVLLPRLVPNIDKIKDKS